MARALKKTDKEKNPGLAKLPKEVRNKMGYMKEGGKTFVEKIKQKRAERKAKREAGEGRRVGRKFVKKNMAAEAAGKPVDLEYLFTEGKGDGSVRDVKRGINKYKKNQRKRNRLAQKKNKKKFFFGFGNPGKKIADFCRVWVARIQKKTVFVGFE